MRLIQLPPSISLSLSLSLIQKKDQLHEEMCSLKMDCGVRPDSPFNSLGDKINPATSCFEIAQRRRSGNLCWFVVGKIVAMRNRQEPLIAVEPCRPPMTNVGTETAFRHDHCKHFEKVNILWGQRSVDAIKLVFMCRSSTTLIYKLSVTDFNPKGTISEVRVHTGLYLVTGCWSITKYSRISTKFSSSSSRSFDHHDR